MLVCQAGGQEGRDTQAQSHSSFCLLLLFCPRQEAQGLIDFLLHLPWLLKHLPAEQGEHNSTNTTHRASAIQRCLSWLERMRWKGRRERPNHLSSELDFNYEAFVKPISHREGKMTMP